MAKSFTPAGNGNDSTVCLAANPVSQVLALDLAVAPNAEQVEFTNEGPNSVFVILGTASAVAVAPVAAGASGGYVIGAGQSKLVDRSVADTHFAAITNAAELARVYATVGSGG
jgi:hypothetical protein